MSAGAATVVTGAGGGIGRAAALELAGRGARVLCVDVDADALDSLASADVPGELAAHPADVSSAAAVQGIVAEALRRWDRIDGVFNNAGIEGPVQALGDYPEEAFDRVFAVNVKSCWLMTKHALPALVRTRGAIVNTASTAGLMGWPRLVPYVGSKHAIVGLTRAAAMEAAPAGVRVNAICPGPTDTRMLRAIGEANAPGDARAAMDMQTGDVPLGRLADPAEIASLAVWLLLDAPGFLTGATLSIDGGQTAGFAGGR